MLNATISFSEAGQSLVQPERRSEIPAAIKGVQSLIYPGLTQGQFDALVSFTANCGVGALRVSSLRKLINRGQWMDAAQEFDKWDVCEANTPTIRQREKQLFLS